MLGCPSEGLDSPICLDTPNMFGCSIYLDASPVCLDVPHMFGHHSMFGCPHMFGHHSMFGCPPFIWMHPLYVWIPPNVLTPSLCLDAPCVWKMFGCLLYLYNIESMLCQTGGCPYAPIHLDAPYVWTPPFVWMSLIPLDAMIHLAASKHTVEQPNMWTASKHMEVIQMYGGIWKPLTVTKHAFLALMMYRGHPHVWGHMDTPLV